MGARQRPVKEPTMPFSCLILRSRPITAPRCDLRRFLKHAPLTHLLHVCTRLWLHGEILLAPSNRGPPLRMVALITFGDHALFQLHLRRPLPARASNAGQQPPDTLRPPARGDFTLSGHETCPCRGSQAESGWLFHRHHRGETCIA